mmetsp:Transcript_17414/g.35969  ORF Transcript_17414/g.35969 Transcript_17414/m.35969 type:complete len:100 (+) Transcript_17414:355-654(+)
MKEEQNDHHIGVPEILGGGLVLHPEFPVDQLDPEVPGEHLTPTLFGPLVVVVVVTLDPILGVVDLVLVVAEGIVQASGEMKGSTRIVGLEDFEVGPLRN